jgi:hypothetical protein
VRVPIPYGALGPLPLALGPTTSRPFVEPAGDTVGERTTWMHGSPLRVHALAALVDDPEGLAGLLAPR